MNARERIVARALDLFNARGIEYVGMRELAASLDTKLGNITYYFPTKEDLILRLSADLSARNSSILKAGENVSMKEYLEMTQRHFESQYQYRCLFLSFVHLMHRYKRISSKYKRTEEERRKTALKNIENLSRNGYLKKLSSEDKEFLLSAILFLSRFWISEAAITHRKSGPSGQMNHYLGLMANIMFHYCSAKGRAQVVEFIGK